MIMLINQYPIFGISSCTVKTNINKNKQENLNIISFRTVNKLMTTSAIIEQAPLLQPSTGLMGKKKHMDYLYMAHRQFSITPEDKFQDQLALT